VCVCVYACLCVCVVWKRERFLTPRSFRHLSVCVCVSEFLCVRETESVCVCVCVHVCVCERKREREREISKGRSMPVSLEMDDLWGPKAPVFCSCCCRLLSNSLLFLFFFTLPSLSIFVGADIHHKKLFYSLKIYQFCYAKRTTLWILLCKLFNKLTIKAIITL